MSLLKQWSWAVAAADNMAWGIALKATAASLGLVLANWVLARV